MPFKDGFVGLNGNNGGVQTFLIPGAGLLLDVGQILFERLGIIDVVAGLEIFHDRAWQLDVRGGNVSFANDFGLPSNIGSGWLTRSRDRRVTGAN